MSTAQSQRGTRILPLRRLAGGWWLEAVLIALFAILTWALAAKFSPLLTTDLAIRDWCDAHRPDWALPVVTELNRLGQGGPQTVVAIGLAAWQSRRKHSIRPFLLIPTTYLLLVLIVLPLKLVLDRPGPHGYEVEHPEWLFQTADAMSYPGGHLVNAVAWYTVFTLILGQSLSRRLVWVVRILPVPVVVATTTYASFHWLSDDLAGILLGVVLARLLCRISWDQLPLGSRLARSGWDRPCGFGQLDRP